MRPQPYVVVQGLITALALTALALLGVEAGALVGGATVAVAGASLTVAYRLGLRRATRIITARRSHDDWLVTGTWVAVSVAVGGSLVLARLGFVIADPPAAVRATAGGMSIISTGVLVSSLIDWYWILPRVTGLVRLAPWESPGERAWSQVTRVWLTHRALATLAISAGVVFVPLSMAAQASESSTRAAWYAAAGVLAGAVLPLNQRLVFALNPPVHVGDVLQLPGATAYVLDVAPAGARVRVFGEGRWRRRWHTDKGDRIIPLRDLRRYPKVGNPPRLPADAVQTDTWRASESNRLEQHATEQARPPSVRRDEIDDLLDYEADARRTQRARRGQAVSLEVVFALIGAVASLAAAAAQLASSEVGLAVVVAAVAALGLVTGVLVRSAIVSRRRELGESDSAVVTSIAAELEEIGETVDAQRRLIRETLGNDGVTRRGGKATSREGAT